MSLQYSILPQKKKNIIIMSPWTTHILLFKGKTTTILLKDNINSLLILGFPNKKKNMKIKALMLILLINC